MKKYILSILALFAMVFSVSAQVSSNITFLQTVEGYFAGFNTNLSSTFQGDHLNIWAGADTVNNQTMAASFGIEYELTNNFSVESVTRNTTVAGVVMSEQAGFGYNLTYIDTRLTVYVDGGYRFDTYQPYVAPGFRIKKALTANTYAGCGLELPIYLRHDTSPSPTLELFTGFRY